MSNPAFPSETSTSRLLCLDVLRGITIALMILVNNNGDEAHSYWPLRHSLWNGCTPTDLVFPTFLFLVGISLVFSTESRLAQGQSKSSLLSHTVRRTAILILLGLLVNGFPFFHWTTLRIYGVLQRIALCYLLGSLIYLASRRVQDKVLLLAAILLGYWALMRWIPVPGYGLPGHAIPFLDKDANWVAWLDRHIFPGRLYEGTRDPEGLLSTFPALGTTLIGILTGIWLRTKKYTPQKIAWGLLLAALFGLTSGWVWSLWFPLNKKLWTSSYVLYAAGWSLLTLAALYWWIEIQQKRRGLGPWLVFGKNSIFCYVFAELFQAGLTSIRTGNYPTVQRDIFFHMERFLPSPPIASLAYALCMVVFCWAVASVLYRRRIFLKV